jgi:sugar lactone lactonase YvrE/DNA-directed RNA polymerase subunit RPC12/RpoP
MPAPLRCPTCSAPIDIPPEHATTARCSYCGAGVLLTERGGHVRAAATQQHHATAIADVLRSLRAGDKLSAIRSYREHFGVGLAEARYAVDRLEAGQTPGAPPARPAGSRGVVILAGLVGLLTVVTPIFFAWRSETNVTVSANDTPVERLTPAPRGGAGRRGFAEPVLRFGSEGVGAGRFQDARSVAVDGAGRIYVAEYSGGRVQVFDSAGTFLTQWMANPEPLVDLEADRGGTVYVVQSGQIRRYEGATGRALGEIPRPRMDGYDDVVLALDGSLWAATQNSVVHLGRDGEVRRTIDLDVVDERASPERVAVDANGNLFVLDRWRGQVYHLDPSGKFIDRFEAGDGGPASHMTPQGIAVDGRGRLYVSDLGAGVRVFNASGQLLGTVGEGVVFGITLTDRDELFAAHRNDHQIVKYRLAGAP